MSDTGSVIAGTGANVAGVGTINWINPGSITADDGLFAEASEGTSKYLQATNFGFAVPSGATITGIVVLIERWRTGNQTVKDNILKIIKGGTVGGTDKADTSTDWGTTAGATVSYGTSSDLWGNTLTDTDVNASNFGVALSITAVHSGKTGHTSGNVDRIEVTVYYTASGGGGGGSQTFSSGSFAGM